MKLNYELHEKLISKQPDKELWRKYHKSISKTNIWQLEEFDWHKRRSLQEAKTLNWYWNNPPHYGAISLIRRHIFFTQN